MSKDDFIKAIQAHENEWVVYKDDTVIARGKSVVEVVQAAEKQGAYDYTILKVPPFDVSLAP